MLALICLVLTGNLCVDEPVAGNERKSDIANTVSVRVGRGPAEWLDDREVSPRCGRVGWSDDRLSPAT